MSEPGSLCSTKICSMRSPQKTGFPDCRRKSYLCHGGTKSLTGSTFSIVGLSGRAGASYQSSNGAPLRTLTLRMRTRRYCVLLGAIQRANNGTERPSPRQFAAPCGCVIRVGASSAVPENGLNTTTLFLSPKGARTRSETSSYCASAAIAQKEDEYSDLFGTLLWDVSESLHLVRGASTVFRWEEGGANLPCFTLVNDPAGSTLVLALPPTCRLTPYPATCRPGHKLNSTSN